MIRLAEWEKQVMLDDAREEGLKQGYEEGIKQNIQEIILSLLKKNMSLEDISDITGKTIDEIKEISKNN